MINLPGDEIFTGGITGRLNASAIRRWAEQNGIEPVKSMFSRDNCTELLNAHEWDASYASRINYLLDNQTELWKPLILVDWDDGKGVYLVDGWHRLAIFYKVTKQSFVPFMAYRTPRRLAEQFRVSEHALLGDVKVKA